MGTIFCRKFDMTNKFTHEIYLDSEHRIVVEDNDISGEAIRVERCWPEKNKEPVWFEDHATYVRLIQAAWCGSKWYHKLKGEEND
jgi:hypothetical protein